MKAPKIVSTLIIADDAKLAARLSCRFATKRSYVPVLDGPRMQRPDREAEIVRRNNAAARAEAERVVFAGLDPQSVAAFTKHFSAVETIEVSNEPDLQKCGSEPKRALAWGNTFIGLGLLKALRTGSDIIFGTGESSSDTVPANWGHIVICESGNELTEVTAANYAFSMDAGLQFIPRIPDETADEILQLLYGINDESFEGPKAKFETVQARMRALCGQVNLPREGSITFISHRLPLGLAFPELPSTHLFTYPDLGIAIVNGLAGQEDHPGTRVTTLVDPSQTPAPEIDRATSLLKAKGSFVRVYKGPLANVSSVSRMIEHFPYDLLIIATHCGDVSGHRWTYDFDDSAGRRRELVVDIALGIGQTDDPEFLDVTKMDVFHSLDGVLWTDPDRGNKVEVGTAIHDYIRLNKDEVLEPALKVDIPRVRGSAVLRMHDHNFIMMKQTIANACTPVVINNACVSWHQLAGRFMFANASAYVGTVIEINASEAEEVTVRILDKHFAKWLPHALWSAQRETYGSNWRRPYIISGVYTQRLQPSRIDAPKYLMKCLLKARAHWGRELARGIFNSEFQEREMKRTFQYFEEEIAWFESKWFPNGVRLRPAHRGI